MLSKPLNIPKWLEENSHLLKPPINNYCVYNTDMTVMIVGGPNARTDYHINSTSEFFYQYRGAMLLQVMDEGVPSAIPIHEGDTFLLPPNVPHNPVRFADTVGIVVEMQRPAGALDRLRWYCRGCGGVVHEVAFRCVDLGVQVKEEVEKFAADLGARTCVGCGVVADLVPVESKAPVRAVEAG
ncbi:MAG: 3-hydroxyanthranilic acid dioxygenase [Trizodia sp. TS-e1964]|nr:MAG: 3-hydroxyanthranilic acid dioxygenase [Trizodia sp. TS-e1964]